MRRQKHFYICIRSISILQLMYEQDQAEANVFIHLPGHM